MLRSPFHLGAALAVAAVAFALAPAAVAQEADPADVNSADAIIHALYDVISGPMGQDRDEKRWHSLFAPGARLIPTGTNPETGQTRANVITPQEYWERSSEGLKRIGFRENEIGRTSETFGHITHAFSAYESFREDRGDPDAYFDRGINSIQLLNDGERWWILSVYWDRERDDNPIPAKYIGG